MGPGEGYTTPSQEYSLPLICCKRASASPRKPRGPQDRHVLHALSPFLPGTCTNLL